METQKSDTITIKKDALWKYSTFALLAVVVLLVIFYVLPGKSSTNNVVVQPGQQLPSEPTARVEVNIEGSPVEGDSDAEVTIVEFSDYQCPFCQRAYQQSFTSMNQFIKSGKAKLVMKEYPLPFHQNAQKSAEAARCARDQGGDTAYFKMHDVMFTKGSGDGTGLDVASLKQYAKDLGLDVNNFNTCLDSGKFADVVAADLAYGSQLGVGGTPSFFINGRMISGACPDATFKAAVEAELAGDDWDAPNCQFVKL